MIFNGSVRFISQRCTFFFRNVYKELNAAFVMRCEDPFFVATREEVGHI